MSTTAHGSNLAVTQDGSKYKLTRPDDYVTAPAPKRTMDEANLIDSEHSDNEPSSKRAKEHRSDFPKHIERPMNLHYGMRSVFPGLHDDDEEDSSDEMTNEALAYLRSVRYIPRTNLPYWNNDAK